MRQVEFSFTDDDLRQAASILRQRMLDSLPAPDDCHYEASSELQEKIDQIIIRDRHRTTFRKIRNWAAMIALCVLLSYSAWLAVNTEARAAFFQWVREVYEDSVIYYFFGEKSSDELPRFSLTGLPSEYEETVFQEPFMHTVIYQSEMDMIILTYQRIDENTRLSFVSSDMDHEIVTLDNYTADFYKSKDPSLTNELVWIDEESCLAFCISSFMEKDILIELANSVEQMK